MITVYDLHVPSYMKICHILLLVLELILILAGLLLIIICGEWPKF